MGNYIGSIKVRIGADDTGYAALITQFMIARAHAQRRLITENRISKQKERR